MSEKRITAALRELIGLVRSVRQDDGAPCVSMECEAEVASPSGAVERWKVTVERQSDSEEPGDAGSHTGGR